MESAMKADKIINSFLCGMLFIISFQTHAAFQREDNIDEAVGICSKLSSNNERLDCLKSVGSAFYFSSPALNVCAKFNSDLSKKNCVTSIINKDIREQESLSCGKQIYENDRKLCLNNIRRMSSPVNTRDLPSVGDGINEAAELCSNMPLDSDKLSCVKSFGVTTYYSVSAVKVCSTVIFDKDKQSCLATIADKDIRESEASACGLFMYESDKRICLGSIQRKIPAFRIDHRGHTFEDGLKEAASICLNLAAENDKRECLTILDTAHSFPIPALKVCAQFAYASEIKNCIGIVANKDIREFEASVCKSQGYDTDKRDCLKGIQRKTEVSNKRNFLVEDGIDEVAKLCDALTYESDKRECMKIVGAAYYFSIPAVAICSSFTYDSDKVACVATIANKEIKQSEVMSCGTFTYESDKKSCLNKAQKSLTKSYP